MESGLAFIGRRKKMEEKKIAKFEAGRIVATKGIAERMEKDAAFDEFCEMSLRR